MSEQRGCEILVTRHLDPERFVECGTTARWQMGDAGLLMCDAHYASRVDGLPRGFIRRYPRPWWRLW